MPPLGLTIVKAIVGLKLKDVQAVINTEQKQLAELMVEYLAQAIFRTQLTKALEIANVNSETEKLRSALLSSVSHDLRSPLDWNFRGIHDHNIPVDAFALG
jgi:two-component system, OmpR family, sensor histidine kinase KdpD